MMNQSLEVEGRQIGYGCKTLLIAEMSANHDKDLDQAFALVDLAAETRWDCVKLQTYDADSLSVPSSHSSMNIDPVWGVDNLYRLYQKACMPMEFHEPLFARIRARGMIPFTSIYDPKDIDFVEKLNCSLYKIASFELTFDDLLATVANTGKPLILSTGMANLDEVDHALETIEKHGGGPVVLLHCCSVYPAPIETVNLKSMLSMKKRFNRMIGFSDHTIGSVAAMAASAMGAKAIEKHFTNDVSRKGPDHRFSATPNIMQEISSAVKQIHLAHGDGIKRPQPSELESINVGRRSAFTLTHLPAGHILREKDFRFVRPGSGIPADRKIDLVGKTLIREKSAYEPITYEDLQ